MGNCITFQQVVSWVDDSGWDFIEPESPRHSTKTPKFQDEEPPTVAKSIRQEVLLPVYTETSSLATKTTKSTHEVRIRISKNKLAELLKQAESKGMSMQDVLASIIEARNPHVRQRVRKFWQPGLQSIPEIIE